MNLKRVYETKHIYAWCIIAKRLELPNELIQMIARNIWEYKAPCWSCKKYTYVDINALPAHFVKFNILFCDECYKRLIVVADAHKFK
jgi:hypothetical protein